MKVGDIVKIKPKLETNGVYKNVVFLKEMKQALNKYGRITRIDKEGAFTYCQIQFITIPEEKQEDLKNFWWDESMLTIIKKGTEQWTKMQGIIMVEKL